MNKFQNELIVKEEPYENGFFPKVPKSGKSNSAIILTGGEGDDIIVNGYTTPKQIRQGKYTQLVEISTCPYLKEIRFRSPSQEAYYSFDVYVKAVIQVNDPIVFYANRNIDVDAYFENIFSLDVKKITRSYSVLHYERMDSDLTEKLSSYNTVDESTGFKYQISAVDAQPSENAKEYVQKHGQQTLDAELRQHARNLANKFTKSFEEALMTEVAERKISEREAILMIDEYRNASFEGKIRQIDELRSKGLLTDKDARGFVTPALEEAGARKLIENSKQERSQNTGMDGFYENGGQK